MPSIILLTHFLILHNNSILHVILRSFIVTVLIAWLCAHAGVIQPFRFSMIPANHESAQDLIGSRKMGYLNGKITRIGLCIRWYSITRLQSNSRNRHMCAWKIAELKEMHSVDIGPALLTSI